MYGQIITGDEGSVRRAVTRVRETLGGESSFPVVRNELLNIASSCHQVTRLGTAGSRSILLYIAPDVSSLSPASHV